MVLKQKQIFLKFKHLKKIFMDIKIGVFDDIEHAVKLGQDFS